MVKVPKSQFSGRLRKPGRPVPRVSEFSTSFTEKIKTNNDTLAKSLALARLQIEQQGNELKLQKSNYTELLLLKSLDETRNKEGIQRMEKCFTRCMNQVRGAIDSLIEMKAEFNLLKANENGPRRFHSDQSSRSGSLTQTQSVGPMVQGHCIQQPRISLSRINPCMENGGRVPPVPLPAVPASAADRASPNRRRKPTNAFVFPQKTSTAAVPTKEKPSETREMFIDRVLSEDPLEGPSHGSTRRLFRIPKMAVKELSDKEDDLNVSDDDIDFCASGPDNNRTSYSPSEMDITLSARRLSTITQEPSPLVTDTSFSHSDQNVPSSDPVDPKENWQFSEIEELSPIAPALCVDVQPMGDARDQLLQTTPIVSKKTGNKLTNLDNSYLKAEPMNITPAKEMQSTRGDSVVRPSQSEKRSAGRSLVECSAERSNRNPSATQSSKSGKIREVQSAPSCLTKQPKREFDPEWRPSSESRQTPVRSRLKPRKKRKIFLNGKSSYKELEDLFSTDNSKKRMVPAKHNLPRVLINRLDTAAIEEARQSSSSRALERIEDGEMIDDLGRSSRRVKPVSYKEPNINVKMRRD